MFILYDFIFVLFALLYLPVFIFRGKFHSGFLNRLGFFPKDIQNSLAAKRPIWLHMVSVGEAQALRILLEKLRKEYPDRKIALSTVTPTGNKIARSIAVEGDLVFYLPLDISFIVRSVADLINPCLFVIAETEIWPNLITYLSKRGIPIISVNSRISDRSFKSYKLIKFLLKGILNKISLFCAQTQTDSRRLLALGVDPKKIKLTGNMKFDTSTLLSINGEQSRTIDNADYRRKLGLKEADRLLTAGSTHPGEEEIILGVYKELLSDFPALKLLIAPRHPERAKEIERLALNYGFNSVFISKLRLSTIDYQLSTVFILDTIGQLKDFYVISDIVFMGGSLIKKGGQNILEPAVLAKPIIFGPHMFNFRDIAELFLVSGGAVLVKNKEELREKIKDLLLCPESALGLGRRARELLLKNQGASERNLEIIKEVLSRKITKHQIPNNN